MNIIFFKTVYAVFWLCQHTIELKVPTHTNRSSRSKEQSGCEGIVFKDIIEEIFTKLKKYISLYYRSTLSPKQDKWNKLQNMKLKKNQTATREKRLKVMTIFSIDTVCSGLLFYLLPICLLKIVFT